VESDALRNTIARFHGVASDRVVLGCGSGEILRMAADAFLGLGKKLVVAQPTFELMADFAQRAGAEVVAIPLTHDYSHDLSVMLAHSDPATALVYICNPNNPTGTLTPRRDLEAFIRRLPQTTFVLIDEAYHHYVGESSDYASFLDRPIDDNRVIVTRSFSQVYGLAGMRVGYGVAAPQTASLLASSRLPDGVNALAAKAAAAALGDPEHVQLCLARNGDDRQEFFNQSHARMLKPIDSQTNFVMMNTGRPAVEVVEHFKKNDVLVSGSIPAFDSHIRVSLGSQADMRQFWRVWDLMPAHRMSM
jgi:histidinol-phosphate aminotransferase